MRARAGFVPLVLSAALFVGCGGSDETTASTAVDADASAADIRSAWEEDPACMPPKGASRWGCTVGAYRCQGVVTDRGWSISCARPGRSIGFTVRGG